MKLKWLVDRLSPGLHYYYLEANSVTLGAQTMPFIYVEHLKMDLAND